MTKFFNHAYGGNAIGRVDKNGKVYDNERMHYGKCIGRVEGPNILSAGAAYLLLFNR